MKSSEGKAGRVFILQLENGDLIPACIEKFAAENHIRVAHVTIVGGLCRGNVVVGPRESYAKIPDPMSLPASEAYEVLATGIIAPTEEGSPILHIHGALGRAGQTLTGCLRMGIEVWLTGEAVIYEIETADVRRLIDPETGFKLLRVTEK